jgi:hypothetical protein
MVTDYNAGTVIYYSDSENFITSTLSSSFLPMFIYHHSSINGTMHFNYTGGGSINAYYYENDTDSYILIHDMNVSGEYELEIFIYNLNNPDPIWSSNEKAYKFAFSPISNIIYYRDYSGNLISANISNPGEKTVVYLEDGVSAYRYAGIDIANDGVLVAFPGTTSNDERDMFITNGIESANLTSDHMKETFPLFINP